MKLSKEQYSDLLQYAGMELRFANMMATRHFKKNEVMESSDLAKYYSDKSQSKYKEVILAGLGEEQPETSWEDKAFSTMLNLVADDAIVVGEFDRKDTDYDTIVGIMIQQGKSEKSAKYLARKCIDSNGKCKPTSKYVKYFL